MLKVILACYTEFEERVDLLHASGTRSTAYDIVKQYAQKKIGKFTSAEILAACPSLGRSSIGQALKRLTEDGMIRKCGVGKSTYYVRSDAVSPTLL